MTGFLDANRKPLRVHEDISVFYRSQPTYNPQFTIGNKNHSRGGSDGIANRCYAKVKALPTVMTNEKYPTSIVRFKKDSVRHHATQKPVALCEWLIKTYTNKGDTVLDCCMGSGSTLVACHNTGRKGIGIEMIPDFFDIAVKRIKESQSKLRLDL